MQNAQDLNLFENYTTNSSLSDLDEATMIQWSGRYFDHIILPRLPKDKDARILEVGCGYGRFVKRLEQLGYTNVEGVDISKDQVTFARTKLGLTNVHLSEALAYLQKQKHQYDCIYMIDVLEHLDMKNTIDIGHEIYAKLKDSGTFVAEVPNGISPMTPHTWWDYTHLRAYTTHSMIQYMMLIGFKDIANFSVPPFIHGLKSFIRWVAWYTFLYPIIWTFMVLANGRPMGGIYTSLMITTATKGS
jgi:2-polyprenyl-3-methyl-5-hydroxy-6-metoxy-1,4-benzoquinol methylase